MKFAVEDVVVVTNHSAASAVMPLYGKCGVVKLVNGSSLTIQFNEVVGAGIDGRHWNIAAHHVEKMYPVKTMKHRN